MAADSVGYRKPPKQHRFGKGKSGNPRGRPMGAQSTTTLLAKLLARRISINQTGQKISVRDALALQLLNGALTGDPRLVQLLLGDEAIEEKPPVVYLMDEGDENL